MNPRQAGGRVRGDQFAIVGRGRVAKGRIGLRFIVAAADAKTMVASREADSASMISTTL